MPKTNNIILFIIILIFAATIWMLFPVDAERLGREGLQLGLDLVGGVHLVYQADFTENTTTDRQAAMERTILTIERRIDRFGVTEPVIQQLGADRIMIQLPGFTDIEAAKSLVEQTGYLEFREVEINTSGQPVTLGDYISSNSTDFINTQETGNRVFVGEINEDGISPPIAFLTKGDVGLSFTDVDGNPIDINTINQYTNSLSWIPARGDNGIILTGDLLEEVQPNQDTSQTIPKYVIGIKWNSEGAEIFNQIAARLYQRTVDSPERCIGIFLDNALLSAPQIQQSNYADGKGQIEGTFTIDEVQRLANLLKSGSLPMPLVKPPEFYEKVSATLGAEFIDMSWKAGLIGIALVMIFMIAYYRLPGLMASLALIFYATLTLTICKLWPITLSLGSIGGIIVSLGIAVDANVLIFERMKEEFRAGRTLRAAVEAGFHRAWSAIWDSNMTTFIACIILYWLGNTGVHNAAVIGFAVTLFVGALVSIFTAVLVTRTLLRALAGTGLSNKIWLFTVSGGKK